MGHYDKENRHRFFGCGAVHPGEAKLRRHLEHVLPLLRLSYNLLSPENRIESARILNLQSKAGHLTTTRIVPLLTPWADPIFQWFRSEAAARPLLRSHFGESISPL